MRTTTTRRGVRATAADLETYRAKGFTIRDSWTPRPAQAADATQKSRYGAGVRHDLGIYVRSTWEGNYARYLNLLVLRGEILRWQYEPDEFEFPVKRGRGKFYTPDFKVWASTDVFCYHEVKGQMTAASLTKLKRMQKYYPQHQVILIREPQYRQLERAYAAAIPEWEYDNR